MKIQVKLSLFIASMLLILLVLMVAIGTWVINTIIYGLNTELLSLKLVSRIEQIEAMTQLLEESGVTGIPKYVQQAQTEILQRFQEEMAAKTERYYIIAAKDQHVLFQSMTDKGMDISAEVIQAIVETKSGTLSYRDNSVVYFTVYRYIDTWDWLIGAALPETTMFQQREVYFGIVGTFALFVFVGVLLLAYLLGGRLIANPVVALANVAKTIAAGNFDQTIQLRQRDEIGQLADVIQTMAQQLRQNFEQIEAQLHTIQREMAERKQTEEALRENEERFRSIFSQSPIGIELYDKEGHLIDANSVCLDMFGVKNLEVIRGFKLFEDPNLPQGTKERLLNGESVRYESMFDFETVKAQNFYETTKSGQCFLECFLTQWGSGSDDLKGFLVHVTDITERKQMEAALRESEEKYRILAENSPIGIFVSDAERFIYTNQHLCKITGFSRDELLNMPDPLGSLFAPEERKRLLTYARSRLSGSPVPTDYETCSIRKDGKEVSLKLTVVSIVLSGRRVLQGTVEDITERKRAEEQIKNQNFLLEQAVQEKQREMEALFDRLLRQEKLATIGQMAGSIAHELRNPLGAAKNSVFFLKRLWQKQQVDASNPKVQEHLALIETELDTSERVISNLLQLTRMKPIKREQTDLRPIIEDAASHCQLPEQIRLTFDLKPEPFMIWADPSQLRQVFINLLTNAVQAIEGDGRITISANQVSEDGSIMIEVQDTGTGIAPDALDKVFEPLYTTKMAGTGLGLSICKQIIEHHNGHISLRSGKGQGTTVMIGLSGQE